MPCACRTRQTQNEPTAGARAGPSPGAGERRRPLSLRQLAAARFLARGYGTMKVAQHLGVNHHTIARWKRDPAFIAELEFLRYEMTAAVISPSAPATPPPRPTPQPRRHAGAERSAAPDAPANEFLADDADDADDDDELDNFDNLDGDEPEMSDEEAADIEAWVNDVIRAKRAGGKIPPLPPPRSSL